MSVDLNRLTVTPNSAFTPSPDSIGFEVHDDIVDDRWDTFLAQYEYGEHVQTSWWSRVKAINGWTTKRILACHDNNLIGGAQILMRNTPLIGRVGYVPKGPILTLGNEHIADKLLRKVIEIASCEKLRVVFVQPANDGAVLSRLKKHSFFPCPVETAPSATTLVDLTADSDLILSRMAKGMRNGIRRSLKRGITVRKGGRNDISAFFSLLQQTAKRCGFSTFDEDYFYSLWDILNPSGKIQLFISEYEGHAVSAQYCIAFGNRLIAKQIGWSGQHGRLHPNEALDWFTINWAKSNGFQYYDLEGIDRDAAHALVSGAVLPGKFVDSPTSYKLRLGGDVQLLPGAYCFFLNPALRILYHHLGNRLAGLPFAQRMAQRFRTR